MSDDITARVDRIEKKVDYAIEQISGAAMAGLLVGLFFLIRGELPANSWSQGATAAGLFIAWRAERAWFARWYPKLFQR